MQNQQISIQWGQRRRLTSILAFTRFIRQSNLSISFKWIPYFSRPKFNGFEFIGLRWESRWLQPRSSISGKRYAGLQTASYLALFGVELLLTIGVAALASNRVLASFITLWERLGDEFFSVLRVSGVFTHFSYEKEMSNGSRGSRMLLLRVSIQIKYFLINEYVCQYLQFLILLPFLQSLDYMQINEQQLKKIDIDDRGNPLMTLKTIKYYCYKDCLYETPELNQKLYLHFKGFKAIDSLTHYPNLVTVWLNNNCISKIEGIGSLKNLICLYLNNNVIGKIQGLDGLDRLSVLHLAHNRIDKIEGLGGLPVLNILNVSENFLSSAESLHGLAQSNSLTSIDMSKNELENSDQLFNFVSSLKNISCLCMKNTPIAKVYKNYRKRLIAALPELKYLDDRPVKEIDHRLAQAWIKDGVEGENQERAVIAAENEVKNKRESKQLNEKIRRERKRQEEINSLEEERKRVEDDNENQFKEEQLQQIDRRLQLLKQGPKGFQASITETSIKILHIPQSEQQKIINKYFYNEKLKIEQNIRKMSDQKVSVQEITMGEEEKLIEAKIRRMLNLNGQHQGHCMDSFVTKWNRKYQPVLEALLEKEKFNFQRVLPQFNTILGEINRKMMRPGKKFEARELEHIWYQIVLSRQQVQAQAQAQGER